MLNRRQFLNRSSLAGLALGLPACGGRELPPSAGPRATAYQPRGLHASFETDARSSRSLTWFTDSLDPLPSMIQFDQREAGETPALSEQLQGDSEPTTGVEALTHRVRIEGLDPNLPLRYRVGSEHGWSPIQQIDPMPSDSWRFVHFGDQGVGALGQRLTRELAQEDFDLLLLAGDLSYANGEQPIWDTWFDQMQVVMARTPTLAAPGNHEAKDFGGDAFKNRFTHPQPPTAAITGGAPGSSFYSFDCNRVHVLVTTAGALINDGTLPEELLNIELDLAQAALRRAAGEIDFILIMQHYTIWTDQLGRSPANPSLVALEEDIIVRYGVDLVLVGHDHVYQRSVPMAFGLPNPLGYVQMMVGTGGASVRLFDEDGPQAWSARQFVGIGYARYQVDGKVIRGEFVGAAPEGLDDEHRQQVYEPFRVHDSFEFHARSPLQARQFVRPARDPAILLAQYDSIARHTRARNAHDLRHCG